MLPIMTGSEHPFHALAAKAHAGTGMVRLFGSLLGSISTSVDAERSGKREYADVDLEKKFASSKDEELEAKLASSQRIFDKSHNLKLGDNGKQAYETIAEVKAELERRRKSRTWKEQVMALRCACQPAARIINKLTGAQAAFTHLLISTT